MRRMRQAEPLLLRPGFPEQMAQRAYSGRYVSPGLPPLAQQGGQLLQALHIERRMDCEHDRRASDECDIREIGDRIEALRSQREENMRGEAREQERVAVRRRARDRHRANLPATTRLIVHHEALVEVLAE